MNTNINPSEGQAPHTAYQFQRSYFRSQGLLQVPLAGNYSQGVGTPSGRPTVAAGAPDAACEIVEWSAPFGSLAVSWIARRINALPVLPDYVSSDPNEVFVTYSLNIG